MAVSKHNLWKRQKNGLMKLVRSHSEWLQKRREMKAHVKHIRSGVRTVVTKDKPTVKIKPVVSTKRTQVGKKI